MTISHAVNFLGILSQVAIVVGAASVVLAIISIAVIGIGRRKKNHAKGAAKAGRVLSGHARVG
jgi:hypothetical protein